MVGQVVMCAMKEAGKEKEVKTGEKSRVSSHGFPLAYETA